MTAILMLTSPKVSVIATTLTLDVQMSTWNTDWFPTNAANLFIYGILLAVG